MLNEILRPEIQCFIKENIEKNPVELALKKIPFASIAFAEIINQIVCKSKAKTKLPTWYNTDNIIYPSKISIEQTSSEITAQHKAQSINGKNLIDLTGGFGIDDYYFSEKFENVIHCEINPELSEIVAHNYKVLNKKNIDCYCDDSRNILEKLNQTFDWIYIDPSRRNDAKGKVFLLEDCLPNVPENLDFYYKYSDQILIKTAPILDLSAGINSLKNVKKIEIVALNNEVKELLWFIEKDYTDLIEIKTFNYGKTTEIFDFIWQENFKDISYQLPQQFLFEPNSAIMKSGGFDAVSEKLKVNKLHYHSHLYTANELIVFPGRKFKIDAVLPYQKQEIKTHLEGKKMNITTRNFPESVENIRKKWKIKDGGDQYCFLTTNKNEQKTILICTKI